MPGEHVDKVGALAKVSLFARLSTREAAALAENIHPRNYKTGEIIFHKDDPGITFHLILEGLVKVFVTSDEGQEAVLIILKGGEFFGELSLFDGAPRSASASAIEPTETLVIQRDDFLEFIRQHPDAALNIFSVLASRMRRADGVIADAAFLDLPSRIAKKLIELAQSFFAREGNQIEIDIKLRQQDVASMVSATRESVNRVLTSLDEQGIIHINRQKITILRPDLLQARVP